MFKMFKKNINNISSKIEKSRIMVLGACCKTSKDSFENVKKAVEEMNIDDITVTNIGDVSVIASYGVMSTPALVIDDKVVLSGRLIKTDEAKVLIEKSNVKNK